MAIRAAPVRYRNSILTTARHTLPADIKSLDKSCAPIMEALRSRDTRPDKGGGRQRNTSDITQSIRAPWRTNCPEAGSETSRHPFSMRLDRSSDTLPPKRALNAPWLEIMGFHDIPYHDSSNVMHKQLNLRIVRCTGLGEAPRSPHWSLQQQTLRKLVIDDHAWRTAASRLHSSSCRVKLR